MEELVIDKGNCDKEYSTQTPVKTNSKARRDPDGENKLETRRLMNATPEGYRIKEHSPQIRNQRNYKQCMSRNREETRTILFWGTFALNTPLRKTLTNVSAFGTIQN